MSVTMKFKMSTHPVRPKRVDTLPVPRVARMLALAHFIERAVERGDLRDYTEAARLFGLSRARITQVMNLVLLSPTIQARILTGSTGVWERSLRPVLRTAVWEEQEVVFDKLYS